MTLEEYRRDFDVSAKRSLSMPIAGTIIWFVIALTSVKLDERTGVLVLLFGSGTIFPLALLIAHFRNEAILSSENPLAKLMGLSTLMVNLLWAVHIPLFLYAPTFVPLSIGIALGLHWIVFSWIIQHSLGILHAVLRTLFVVLAWFAFPEQRLLAIGLVIVFVYGISIWQLFNRTLNADVTNYAKIE